MNKSYFITGTDTDVGKTFVTRLLLEQLNIHQPTIGYKPIAAGADYIDGQWRNDDALILQQASSPSLSYQLINPICYPQAIAPHIAAAINEAPIELAQLNQWWQGVKNNSELALIEGAGGWRLPLNDSDYLSDFVKHNQFEVIVVVGMKLGCLNHALLTIEAIKADGLVTKGWIANQLETPMAHYQQNLDYLTQAIKEPLLGEVKSNQQLTENSELFCFN